MAVQRVQPEWTERTIRAVHHSLGIFTVSGSAYFFSAAYVKEHRGGNIENLAPVTPETRPGYNATYFFNTINLPNVYETEGFTYALQREKPYPDLSGPVRPVDVGLASVDYYPTAPPLTSYSPGDIQLNFSDGNALGISPQGGDVYAHYFSGPLYIGGNGGFSVTDYSGPITTVPVPEPSTLSIFVSGTALLTLAKRRRRKLV